MPLKMPGVLLYCLVLSGLTAQDSAPLPKPLIRPADSVFMELHAQRKFVRHEVVQGQTLFAISAYYGLSLDALYADNPALQTDSVLRLGSILKVALPNKAIVRYPGDSFDARKHARLFYRVQPGDNLYGIAKRHFEMPVDSVKKRNRLTSEVLRPGQVLHLGWISTAGIPAEWQTRANTPQGQLAQKYETDKEKFEEAAGQGVGFWQKDQQEENQYYALHRTAVIGTTMWVENPMSHRKTPVKVIGRIPAGFDPNIHVILSPATARYLGAIDARFFVKTRYLKAI